MVISWLLNVLSPEIKFSLVYLDTAKAIGEDLNTRFSHSNLPFLKYGIT